MFLVQPPGAPYSSAVYFFDSNAGEILSEIEVRFVAEGPDRTRVQLEHRHLDRHGPGWTGVRDGVDNDQGWPLYLSRYADLLAAA